MSRLLATFVFLMTFGMTALPLAAPLAAQTQPEGGSPPVQEGTPPREQTETPATEPAQADTNKPGAPPADANTGDRFEEFFRDPSVDSGVALFGPLLLKIGQAVIALLVLLLVVSFVSRWASRGVKIGLGRTKLDPGVVGFLAQASKWGVWIISVPVVFAILGVQATSLAAAVGAAGLAIGLALQGALSNIAAGIMLLVLRPFRVGDVVELGGETGEVEEIGVFHTQIKAFSGQAVLLPNSDVLGSKIENYTAKATRRVDVAVGVAYGTDLRHAGDVLKRALEGIPSRAADTEVTIALKDFGDSSINFEARVWCESRSVGAARTEAVLAIQEHLEREGIEIPFPQRWVHVRSQGGAGDPAASR